MTRWLRKGLGAGVLLATGALADRLMLARRGGEVAQPDGGLERAPADEVDLEAAPAALRLVNLFLRPQEAAALPFRVDFPYGDPETLDAERMRAGDRDTPITTAIAYLDTNKFEEQLIPDIAWMSALLSFISRSPTYADALITRGGQPGGRWERLRTDLSLPKYGRRKGSRMFRTPDDLRAFFDTGWALRDANDFATSVIPTSFEWHNFARQGRGQHFLEFQLIHQWIALELLAARWAKENRRSSLLTRSQMSSARDCLTELAQREGLDDAVRQALIDKAAELERRPMKLVVLEYLRAMFQPYPAQPSKDDLETLINDMIRARNKIVHDGSLLLHETPEAVERVVQGIARLEGITARALLAELGVPLALLTEVPWTAHRTAA